MVKTYVYTYIDIKETINVSVHEFKRMKRWSLAVGRCKMKRRYDN
jgi:hypothetical protein